MNPLHLIDITIILSAFVLGAQVVSVVWPTDDRFIAAFKGIAMAASIALLSAVRVLIGQGVWL